MGWPKEMVAVLTMPPQARHVGSVSSRLKVLGDGLQLVARSAVETARVGRVAVELDEPVLGDAGFLVQPVDVLGDDAGNLAAADELGDGEVAAIGRGVVDGLPGGELAPPGLAARLLGMHEVLEVDGLVLGPDAPGAAEVRDAGLGADAGPGEDDGAAAGLEHLAQAIDGLLECVHGSFPSVGSSAAACCGEATPPDCRAREGARQRRSGSRAAAMTCRDRCR